jgi:transcriptional regulator with XRE-family HTH domain
MTVEKASVDFGRLVRAHRKAKKLKSWKVAEQVDIEVKHLGRIERGEKKPSFELIIALAEALSVSPSKFFEFESASTDFHAIKKQIARQLNGRNAAQLLKARELMAILFDSQ